MFPTVLINSPTSSLGDCGLSKGFDYLLVHLIKIPRNQDSFILLLIFDLCSSSLTFKAIVAVQTHCVSQGCIIKSVTCFTLHISTFLSTCISSVPRWENSLFRKTFLGKYLALGTEEVSLIYCENTRSFEISSVVRIIGLTLLKEWSYRLGLYFSGSASVLRGNGGGCTLCQLKYADNF